LERFFLVDAEKRRFIHYPILPANIIEFDKLPEFNGNHILIYDWARHNHLDVPLEKALKSEDYECILIETAITNLRLTPSKGECEKINRESRENGKGYLLANRALDERLLGKLPTVDIDGQIFYVDYRLGQLRPKDDF